MKIKVSQLRQFIKEELYNAARLEKLEEGHGVSILLRPLVKKMVNDPDAAQQYANDWDKYAAAAAEIRLPPGGEKRSDRMSAFANAAKKAGLMNADAAYYIEIAFDSAKRGGTVLTGQDLLAAASAEINTTAQSASNFKNQSAALKAAKEAGIDLNTRYKSAQAAPRGSWGSEMNSYEDAMERIYRAWDPVAKKLDMNQLSSLKLK